MEIKKILFFLLMCCYQLRAEKIIDCKLIGHTHCEVFTPVKYDEKEEVKFRLPKSKHENATDYIYEISFDAEAVDQIIPASIFKTFPNAVSVYSSNQYIREIKPGTFSYAGNLKYLRMEGHRIKELEADSLVGLSNIERINLKRGNLAKIDGSVFRELKKLEILNLGNNRIKSIIPGTFEPLSNLIELDLGHNLIASLSGNVFANLVNLEKINLEDNDLVVLPEKLFEHNSKLVQITLERNYLKKIPTNLFSHLSKLGTLELIQNECIDVNYPKANESFTVIEDNLSTSCNLNEELNKKTLVSADPVSSSLNVVCELQENEKICFVKRTTIKTNDDVNFELVFYIEPENSHANHLAWGKTFYGYKPEDRERQKNVKPAKIEEVEIRFSKILQYIPASLFTTFENMKVLRADNQKIPIIKPKTFVNANNLIELDLSDHKIKRLEANTFEGLEKLAELFLNHGSIGQIDDDAFNGLDNLNVLHLGHNRIKSISPGSIQNLKKLDTLDLEHNAIDQLQANTLTNLENLKSLFFTDNDLEILPASLFDNNKDLEVAVFRGNNLKKIPENTFANLNLIFVGLSANICIDKNYDLPDFNNDTTAMISAIKNELVNC